MIGAIPPDPFELAARWRDLIACALIGLLALTPLFAVSAGKPPVARTGFPIVPANESEPDAEDTEAKLSLRANARWTPPGRYSAHQPHALPRLKILTKSPPERGLSLSPTVGPRLRC